MPVLSGLALAVWQANTDAISAHDVQVIKWSAVAIAFALVVQAIGVLIAGAFAGKLLHRLDKLSCAFDEKTTPLVNKTTQLIDDLSPRVRSISENVEQISYTVREKVDEISVTVSEVNQTVQEINGRTRIQVARADDIVTEAMIATEDISRTVQNGIRIPIRQVVGIVAGFKAGLETLLARSPFGKSKDDGRPYDY
jgi:methyl-accepting chemotaxis protein